MVEEVMSSVGFRDVTANIRLVVNEVPGGAKDGINLVFTTANKFLPGTLEVFLADLKLNGDQTDPNRDYDEAANLMGFTLLIDPLSSTRLRIPPQCDEDLQVSYQMKAAC